MWDKPPDLDAGGQLRKCDCVTPILNPILCNADLVEINLTFFKQPMKLPKIKRMQFAIRKPNSKSAHRSEKPRSHGPMRMAPSLCIILTRQVTIPYSPTARARISSGMIGMSSVHLSLREILDTVSSSGPGTFRWNALPVQTRRVSRQLVKTSAVSRPFGLDYQERRWRTLLRYAYVARVKLSVF